MKNNGQVQSEQQLQDYRNPKLLGTGAYGKAYLVERVRDGLQCVVKQIEMTHMSEEERKEAVKEADVLKMLDHHNIIKYHEHYKTKKGRLNIVMDYAEGGDLNQVIKQAKSSNIDENQILNWLLQLTCALNYIHGKNIIHRDIKAQNVFLSANKIVKLADFGISRVLSSTRDKASTFIGTPYYLAPELIGSQPYSTKADIWSLGVLGYQLCTLRTPFDAESIPGLMMKISKGTYPPIQDTYSKELRQLISEMLTVDPNLRPSALQILEKPIMRDQARNFLSETTNAIQEKRKINNFAMNNNNNNNNIVAAAKKYEEFSEEQQQQQRRPVSKNSNYPGSRYYSPQHYIESKSPLINAKGINGKQEIEFPPVAVGGAAERPISKMEKRKQYAKSPDEPPVFSRGGGLNAPCTPSEGKRQQQQLSQQQQLYNQIDQNLLENNNGFQQQQQQQQYAGFGNACSAVAAAADPFSQGGINPKWKIGNNNNNNNNNNIGGVKQGNSAVSSLNNLDAPPNLQGLQKKPFRVHSPVNKIGAPNAAVAASAGNVQGQQQHQSIAIGLPSNNSAHSNNNYVSHGQVLPNQYNPAAAPAKVLNRVGSPGTRLPQLNFTPASSVNAQPVPSVSSNNGNNMMNSPINGFQPSTPSTNNLRRNLDKFGKPSMVVAQAKLTKNTSDIPSPKFKPRPPSAAAVGLASNQNLHFKIRSQLAENAAMQQQQQQPLSVDDQMPNKSAQPAFEKPTNHFQSVEHLPSSQVTTTGTANVFSVQQPSIKIKEHRNNLLFRIGSSSSQVSSSSSASAVIAGVAASVMTGSNEVTSSQNEEINQESSGEKKSSLTSNENVFEQKQKQNLMNQEECAESISIQMGVHPFHFDSDSSMHNTPKNDLLVIEQPQKSLFNQESVQSASQYEATQAIRGNPSLLMEELQTAKMVVPTKQQQQQQQQLQSLTSSSSSTGSQKQSQQSNQVKGNSEEYFDDKIKYASNYNSTSSASASQQQPKALASTASTSSNQQMFSTDFNSNHQQLQAGQYEQLHDMHSDEDLRVFDSTDSGKSPVSISKQSIYSLFGQQQQQQQPTPNNVRSNQSAAAGKSGGDDSKQIGSGKLDHDKESKIERKIIYKLPFQESKDQKKKKVQESATTTTASKEDGSCSSNEVKEKDSDLEKMLNELTSMVTGNYESQLHDMQEVDDYLNFRENVPITTSENTRFDNQSDIYSQKGVLQLLQDSKNKQKFIPENISQIAPVSLQAQMIRNPPAKVLVKSKQVQSQQLPRQAEEKTLRSLLEKEIGSIHFTRVYKMAVQALSSSEYPQENDEFAQNLKITFPSFSANDISRYTTLFHTLVMLEKH